jgi:hypothetical protein
LETRTGAAVWFDEGKKYRHGVTPTMVQFSFREYHDGRAADWTEHGTDKPYQCAYV